MATCGPPKPRKRARAQLVGVDRARFDRDVLDAVGPAAEQRRDPGHARAVVGIGAGVEDDPDLAREQRAVGRRAGLHPHLAGVAGADHLEILLAAQRHLDRPAGGAGERGGGGLHGLLHLAAEGAAHLRGDAAQLGHRKPERIGDEGLDVEHRLVGRPDGDLAVGIDLGQRRARLHIGVALRLGLVAPLDDRRAALPGRSHVALDDLDDRHRVAVAVGLEDLDVVREALVKRGRVRVGRRVGVEHRRQFLVGDVDQPGGLLGGFQIRRRDRGHRLAHIAHLADRERGLVLDEGADLVVADILARDNRRDAVERERGGDVVARDPRMGVGARHDHADQHVGARHVVGVDRLAGDLVARLEPRDALPDRAHIVVHDAPPALADLTASTTFT